MNKKLKIFLIGLCAVVVYIVLFGKLMESEVTGPPAALNDYSDPMMVGETWNQDDLFAITIEKTSIEIEPETGKKLLNIDVSVEKNDYYSNEDKDMQFRLGIRNAEDEYEGGTNSAIFVTTGMSYSSPYQLYFPENLPSDIEEVILSAEVLTLNRNQFYRNDWVVDVQTEI